MKSNVKLTKKRLPTTNQSAQPIWFPTRWNYERMRAQVTCTTILPQQLRKIYVSTP